LAFEFSSPFKKSLINKEILKLAVPNIISNISIPLLATVDTALMGRLTPDHLGAVGLGSMIFSFIYWNFGFLRMGTTGITAQAYGRKDNYLIAQTLGRAGVLALLISVFILVLQYPFFEVSSYLMNVQEGQQALLLDYFKVRIWAAPATLLLYSLLGWFFGMQNAIFPMILTILINIINIVVSWYLVHHMGMEAKGVAWGTVIAQYSGVILALLIITKKYPSYLTGIDVLALKKIEALKGFLKVNQDLFIRTVGLTFAFGFFYSKSSEAGAIILATNVILLQFVNWMSYGIDGFAYASEALVGKYYGAKNEEKLNRAIRYSMVWGLGFGVFYSLLYAVFGKGLLHLFTDDPEIINYASDYLWWMILFPIAGFACYIWDGVFIGFTASKAMRDTMFIALAFYLLTYYLSSGIHAMHQLWLSLSMLLFMRGLVQSFLYWKYGKTLT
jgi:MATE family multidrug resistance protein